MNNKKITIIEAPICIGSPTIGSENAYSILKENGVFNMLSNVTCKNYKYDRKVEEKPKDAFPYYKNTVIRINKVLYETTYQALQDDTLPMIIGGDHSIAMSSISAISDYSTDKEVAVIYIDGHADINTDKSSKSGYIHGMPLGITLGLCDDDTLSVGKKKKCISGDNVFIIGARSIDPPEYKIINENSVSVFTPDETRKIGFKSLIEDISKKTNGMSVHLSFDVDSIDGDDFKSTGYIMPNGFSFDEIKSLLSEVFLQIDISSFDIVEYNPALDRDNQDLNKIKEIFNIFEKSRNKI